VYGTDAMGGVINIITEDAKNSPTLTTVTEQVVLAALQNKFLKTQLILSLKVV